MLEHSVKIPGNTKRIIGVDTSTGEIVVFDKNARNPTRPNDYHGHVESWDELKGAKDIYKKTLINDGLVDSSGHIIIRDAEGRIIRIGPKKVK